jgi:hypothetical protein
VRAGNFWIARCLLAASLLAAPVLAPAQAVPAVTVAKEDLGAHAEMLADFRAQPGYVESDAGDYIHFLDVAKHRVILVTKPGHPAHPAVVVSRLVEKDEGVAMEPEAVGRGDKAALKAWTDSLRALDPILAKEIVAEANQERSLERVRAQPGIVETDGGDYIRLFDRVHSRVLLFTKVGHPAHPALVTRKVIERDGHLFMASDGVGAGNPVALETWIQSLGQQDADLAKVLRDAAK